MDIPSLNQQVKAVKARKISHGNASSDETTASTGGSSSLLPPPPPDAHPNPNPPPQQQQLGHELRDGTAAVAANASSAPTPTTILPSCPTVPPPSSFSGDAGGGGGDGGGGGPRNRASVRVMERVSGCSTLSKSWNSTTVTPVLFAPPSAPLPTPKVAAVSGSACLVQEAGAGHDYNGKDMDEHNNGDEHHNNNQNENNMEEEEEEEEDVSGGGTEARAVRAYSGETRGPTSRGGGVTVVIPPPGLGAGHLRSPSEVMLGDIAESLADTTKKHSFARMQSVQVSEEARRGQGMC